MTFRLPLLSLFLLAIVPNGFSQNPPVAIDTSIIPEPKLLSFDPAPTLHKGRLRLGIGTATVALAGTAFTFWEVYYKDLPLSKFHTFDDWGEWNHIDKTGHLMGAYTESYYAFNGMRWMGIDRKKAMWTAIGVGSGIQAGMELMDGFSEKWGFSWTDIAFNTLGVGLFASQELAWQEQRITMKMSGIRPAYDKTPIYSTDGTATTTLDERAKELYGASVFEVAFKDYNALSFWASFNLRSFARSRETAKVPAWLNVAVGYGAGNLYGGFDNEWTVDGAVFSLDQEKYPRYRQFFLAPDLDLTKIPTRHKWLKFTLGLLNWIKIPAPTLEINTLGKLKFHPLYF